MGIDMEERAGLSRTLFLFLALALRDLANRIADACDAWFHDFGVDTAKMQLLANRRVHELNGIFPEAIGELLAAVVRDLGDFQHDVTKSKLLADWEVLDAQVHIDKQVVARQCPPAGVAGNEIDGPRVHDGDLHVGMRRPIR